MNSPVVAFFLDAADINYCEKFISMGLMPNLEKFKNKSIFSTIKDKDSIVELGTYNVVFTGKTREEIGYYEFRQLIPGSYEITHDVEGGDFEGEQFWEKLKNTDKKVCILDVFDAKLVNDLKGVQVANWSINNMKRPTQTIPASLINEFPDLKTQLLFNQIAPATEDESLDLLNKLLYRLEKKVEVYTQIIQRDNYHFIAIGFGELHCAGHQFFDYLDVKFENSQNEKYAKLSKAMETVFAKFDECLGQLLQLFPSEYNKIIMSQTGNFGVFPIEHFNEQLCKKLNLQTEVSTQSFFTKIKQLIPLETRIKLSRYIFNKTQRDKILSKQFASNTDWANTKAFTIPSMFHTFIRINLEGREPNGIVKASDYDIIVDEICNKLKFFTDKKSGKPVYDKIIKSKGTYCDSIPFKLPDIIASLNGFDYFLEEINYKKEFTIKQTQNVFFRSNEHTGLGFIMVQNKEQSIDLNNLTFKGVNKLFNQMLN